MEPKYTVVKNEVFSHGAYFCTCKSNEDACYTANALNIFYDAQIAEYEAKHPVAASQPSQEQT